MLRLIWILIISASFQCLATTCASDASTEFSRGEKSRGSFTFKFWETKKATKEEQVIFQIEAPANLNGDKFNEMLLAKGIFDHSTDGYGIFVAVYPHETQSNVLTSTISMKRNMFEGGIISLVYGTQDCSPSYTFEISELLKDKNNWPYR